MEQVPIEGVYRVRGAAVMPHGVVDLGNPLADAARAAAARIAAMGGLGGVGGVVVGWSGWMGEPPSTVDGAVEADFRAWSGEGRRGLDDVVAAVVPLLEATQAHLWLRPHARHVLSDGPSCAAFLRAHAAACAAETIGLLLDLELALTEPMRVRRVEHVERMLEMLLPLPGLAALVVSDEDVAVAGSLLGQAGVGGGRVPLMLRRL